MKRFVLAMTAMLGGCWPTTPPVTMEIHITESVSADYWAAIEDGARYWEVKTGVQFVTNIVYESSRTTASNGVVIVEQVAGLPGFLAHANPENGGCRVKLTASDQTDQYAVAHELGHCLGLDHVDDDHNVMHGVHWVGQTTEVNDDQVDYLLGWVR